jgi:hypothetical protein
MNDEVDLLKIKIDQAKANLSEDTLDAIAAVDWKGAIMKLRQEKGYTFEQLGDLETETELLLCGLTTPEEYPKELKKRMGLSEAEASEVVDTMNDLAFQKIQAALVKNIEREKLTKVKPEQKPAPSTPVIPDIKIPAVNTESTPAPKESSAVPHPPEKNTTEKEETHPMLTQKLTSTFKVAPTETKYSLDNITRSTPASTYPPKSDPYREIPE